MIETILSPSSFPFAVAIGLMLFIALLEVLGVVIGMSPSAALDSMLPDVDIDLDTDASIDLDASAVESIGPLSQLLGWLCVGRVPILILLVVFLTAFGLLGFMVQGAANALVGDPLPSLIAVMPALAGAFPLTRQAGLGLARIMPKEQTEVVSTTHFIGKVATVTLGEARTGLPAEAKLTDSFGKTHYIRVEPDNEVDTFPAGTDVIVVRQSGSHYYAIVNSRSALSCK